MCCVCFVCPGEGNVAFNATPNPFHPNKICLNQTFDTILTLSVPVCDLCGKSFKTSTGLRSHTRNIHSTPDNKCKVCNKLYTSKNNLRAHEEKHIGASIHINLFNLLCPLEQ